MLTSFPELTVPPSTPEFVSPPVFSPTHKIVVLNTSILVFYVFFSFSSSPCLLVLFFSPSLPLFFSPLLYLSSPPFHIMNLHICSVTFSRFIPFFPPINFGVNCIQIYVGHNVCKLSCAFLRRELNIRRLILLLNPKHYLCV